MSSSMTFSVFSGITSARYWTCICDFTCSTTAWISDSLTHAPCTRMGLDLPIGRNRASPWPSSFSAPGWSRTTRESVTDDVANAMREGTLALIRPVTTSTDGRCVARTRWMPAARASWVMRTIASSTSRGATIIRSASSSTMTNRYGYGRSTRLESGGSFTWPARTALLKSSTCL